MKKSIGMVVRNFDNVQPLLGFLHNAQKYGHSIYSVVVAYSGEVLPEVIARLQQETMVYTVKINEATELEAAFDACGISAKAKETLLRCEMARGGGMVPYGFNRNTVLMQAAITGTDYLVFVDSDVAPYVLTRNGENKLTEVDFFGAHFAAMHDGAQFTSSEYSGYNIIPPMHFSGMEDLLFAVQKDNMLPWLDAQGEHGCITFQETNERIFTPTNKLLGGNLGIRLTALRDLPPFYSTVYTLDGTPYLGRGEDTVIALKADSRGVVCTDIGLHLFHDTYANYPEVPDLKNSPAAQQRFFYACTGWIGRNPFYNWIRGVDPKQMYEKQKERIEKGAAAITAYTGNDVFMKLPAALDASFASLPMYKESFTDTQSAWQEFIGRIPL